MFFPESEAIARKHPDLLRVIEQVDARLSTIFSPSPLCPGDFSRVIGADENQVFSVFDLLAAKGVLCCEEMVECEDCHNLMSADAFHQAIDDEDDFECTACSRTFSRYSTPIVVYGMTRDGRTGSHAEAVVQDGAEQREASYRIEPTIKTNVQTRSGAIPIVDRDTFTVRYNGRICELRNTKEFALFERINRRPGQYFSIDTLIQDVWNDELTEKNTIHRTVSSLRSKLRAAGFDEVEIDGKTNRGHYALKILPQ